MTYKYTLTQDTDWQTITHWQTPDTPFMSFEYWQALTDTGAIGEDAGWLPLYIVIFAQDTKDEQLEDINLAEQLKDNHLEEHILAVIPVFIKNHHQGEYVFDHTWAEAYARYGVDYYPRLVTSVPYTPVTGQRFWLADGIELNHAIWEVAIAAIDDVAKQVGASSWHGLFMTADQVESGKAAVDIEPYKTESGKQSTPSKLPVLERQGCQFLWHNENLTESEVEGHPKPFKDFDDFLATLTAKKRKNIRAERKKIAKQQLHCQIKTGHDLTEQDWQTFYQCYAMTYAIRGRHPYLTLDFFSQIAKTLPDYLMMAQGLTDDGEIVASSLFFYDDPNKPNATLYGRYWGSLAEYDSLHFELCYYQGIEFAIAQGLKYFDPGTQGEHKLIRGFVPTKTHSLHRIYDERFVPAIADFCVQDRGYMKQYRQQAHEALPFNIDNMPKFKG